MIRTFSLVALALIASVHVSVHASVHTRGLHAGASAQPAKGKSIEWAATYGEALELARSSNRVVFVAINMDGERANDRMAKKVYKDKAVVALTAKTVNLIASAATHNKSGKCSRFGCSSCAQHRFIDVSVRDRILGAPDAVVSPQHIFMSPAGAVLLSVPYEISADELVWCLHEALQMHAGVETKRRKHAGQRPLRLIAGGVLDLGKGAAPATREEALEIIKEHKKGRGGGDPNEMLRRLATADEPEARAYILTALRAGAAGGGSGRGGRGGSGNADRARGRLIRWIGERSPQSYWEICAEFADSGTADVQNEAVIALEQMANEESLGMLMKAYRRASTNPAAQKNLVRAIGAVGRDDKKARTTLLRASIDKKNEEVRANALIALGWFDVNADVTKRLLEAALPETHGAKAKIPPGKVTPNERLGAVVAMGISRDSEWTPTLQSIADDEDGVDEKLRNAARAALKVIDGGNYGLLDRYQKDAGSDKIKRERLFGFKVSAERKEKKNGERGERGG